MNKEAHPSLFTALRQYGGSLEGDTEDSKDLLEAIHQQHSAEMFVPAPNAPEPPKIVIPRKPSSFGALVYAAEKLPKQPGEIQRISDLTDKAKFVQPTEK